MTNRANILVFNIIPLGLNSPILMHNDRDIQCNFQNILVDIIAKSVALTLSG